MSLPAEFLKKSPEQQEAALKRAMAAYRKAGPSERKQKGREALIEERVDASLPSQGQSENLQQRDSPVTSSIRVWQPSSHGQLLSGMGVEFSGLVMTRDKYLLHLESRLSQQIQDGPAEARDLLTGSPEHSPNLYQIAMSSPLRHWPQQILMSDQMQARLGQIDWSSGVSEIMASLPSLAELVEVL